MKILKILTIVFCLPFVSCQESDVYGYINNLKVGDTWNPPNMTGIHLQCANEELENFEIYRGLENSYFVCVKNKKVVSIWKTPNSNQ